MKRLFRPNLTLYLLLIVLVTAALSHGINMNNFPYFENDEGTYISQAWAILTQGKLAPYTYWYDHAPIGWTFIALWVWITGGFHTFGMAVESGRMFMLVIHIASTVLLFDIARKLTRQPWAGFIAGLLFSLSPLAIYFQRRILLDNMMIFWILVSFRILLSNTLTLMKTAVSAFTFGIAVLTKENAVFFFPAFIYAIHKFVPTVSRRFGLAIWIATSGSLVSIYLLYAAVKGELLPPGFFGTNNEHVSLITTLSEQMSRGNNRPFFNPSSDFAVNATEWMKKDKLIIVSGAIATICTTFLSYSYPYFRLPALFGILFWIFLLRGGLVIDFYIIPMIPFLALISGMVVDYTAFVVTRGKKYAYHAVNIIVCIAICTYYFFHSIGQYTVNETKVQKDAFLYVIKNIPTSAVLAVDAYALTDLWDKGYVNAIWFWKLYRDPEIISRINKSWGTIEYMLVSHEMIRTIESKLDETRDYVRSAFKNSEVLSMFGPSKSTYLNFEQFKSTNGDWVSVNKVISDKDKQYAQSWHFYKDQFIKNYGQVVDPAGNRTTSEGESYAMLRSVLQSDRSTFDDVWTWTKNHLQYRVGDKLFSWLWIDGTIIDPGTAADADIDIATALIMASRRWRDSTYLREAKEIISDIWKKEVVVVQGSYVLASSADSRRPDGYLINPSYFSPFAYRLFAQVDTEHPWNTLSEHTYSLISKISSMSESKLIPNWILLTDNGEIMTASHYVSGDADMYGFDAFRIYYRLAQSVAYYHDARALDILSQTRSAMELYGMTTTEVKAMYDMKGNPYVQYRSLSTAVGVLSVLVSTDAQSAAKYYYTLFSPEYNDGGYWGDPYSYYDQNWVYFGETLLRQYPRFPID